MLIFLAAIEDDEERSEMEQIFERYSQEMFRQAYAVLRNEDDAEDAVQDAFFKIWKHLDKLREVDAGRTKWYVICVARNAAIDIYRKKQIRIQKEEPFEENFSFAYSAEPPAYGNKIYEKIAEFPDRERDVLMLKYVYEFRYKEIAKLLGISTEAVKKALIRAKRRLENLYKEEKSDD